MFLPCKHCSCVIGIPLYIHAVFSALHVTIILNAPGPMMSVPPLYWKSMFVDRPDSHMYLKHIFVRLVNLFVSILCFHLEYEIQVIVSWLATLSHLSDRLESLGKEETIFRNQLTLIRALVEVLLPHVYVRTSHPFTSVEGMLVTKLEAGSVGQRWQAENELLLIYFRFLCHFLNRLSTLLNNQKSYVRCTPKIWSPFHSIPTLNSRGYKWQWVSVVQRRQSRFYHWSRRRKFRETLYHEK